MNADALATALQAEIGRSLAADPSLHSLAATLRCPRLGLDWSGAVGTVRRGGAEPLTTAHALRIASITKVFTSGVALRLFEQGRLPLFTPIAGLIDHRLRGRLVAAGYDPGRITVHHMLTHGSGLRDHAGRNTSYGEDLQRDPAHVWTHDEQIERCLSLGPPLSEPGTHFSYSDTAYLILGDLMERVAGQPLHTLMRRLLNFDGLGLVQTHFERHEPTPPGQWRAGQYLEALDVSCIDCSCDLSGGGGLISTTSELATFMRAAALGELFDAAQTRSLALATPSLVFSPPDALHSALMRCRPVGDELAWMHGGAWGVAAGYCPGSDLSFAVSHNQMKPAPATTGVPGDPSQPGLLDRLASIVQRAAQPA